MKDGMIDYANSLSHRSDNESTAETRGTFECPVCGKNTPHPHSQEDLVSRISELKVRIINAVHLLDAGATKDQVRCHLSGAAAIRHLKEKS